MKVKFISFLTVFVFSIWGCNWGLRTSVEDANNIEADLIEEGDIFVELETDRLPDVFEVESPDSFIDTEVVEEILEIEEQIDATDFQESNEADVIELEQQALCGNGVKEEGEECDDGENNSNTVPDACRTTCVNAYCGDGVVDSGEECDDGANNSDTVPDACRATCVNAYCGDGVVDSDEECENTTQFCDTPNCSITCPSNWFLCTATDGHKACYFIETNFRNHTWSEFEDHCKNDVIDPLAPVGYSYYGLAVIMDSDTWNCIAGHLSTSREYYVGLRQDPSGTEPDGGWYWEAYNGTDWVNVGAFSSTVLNYDFDNAGGNQDCVRLRYSSNVWQFWDCSCDSDQNWDGICMVRF